MASKKNTLRSEIENDKKIQVEMQESNGNLSNSLKEVEKEISEIEKMRAPHAV